LLIVWAMQLIDETVAKTHYLRYSRYVGAIAARFFEAEADIEDVRQEVFIQLFSRWDSIEDKERVRGWLAQVTVRTSSRRLRSHRRRGVEQRALRLQHASGATALPVDPVARLDLRRRLAALRDEERRAFVMRRFEGRQVLEVASACGCSPATAKRRVASAAFKLREQLAA